MGGKFCYFFNSCSRKMYKRLSRFLPDNALDPGRRQPRPPRAGGHVSGL